MLNAIVFREDIKRVAEGSILLSTALEEMLESKEVDDEIL